MAGPTVSRSTWRSPRHRTSRGPHPLPGTLRRGCTQALKGLSSQATSSFFAPIAGTMCAATPCRCLPARRCATQRWPQWQRAWDASICPPASTGASRTRPWTMTRVKKTKATTPARASLWRSPGFVAECFRPPRTSSMSTSSLLHRSRLPTGLPAKATPHGCWSYRGPPCYIASSLPVLSMRELSSRRS
jgi:hypothetical protein